MRQKILSANPYMPLWEHVPDGEPRVFEYNGEKRVYVYGSHDTAVTEYCGDDYVCWSAPVNDLTDWTCHGVCYKATNGSILYAPDVVQKGDTFYMYAAENKGGCIMVASSKNPAGPFENPKPTKLGFDPGILVDDDGRIYAYWGFCRSFAAELCDDMITIKEDTFVENLIGHCSAPWSNDESGLDKEFAFFEASSPRKVGDKYILVYSKRANLPQPELGVYEDCNGFLSYAYSDTPLGGFQFGGDISFNGGEIIKDSDGNGHMTFRWGNNHGSIMKVKDQWYVFYHRQTGTDEFARQGMVEPIEVAFDNANIPFIGKIIRKGNEPIASVPVEMTSQGANIDGLDAYKEISAGYACVLCDSTFNCRTAHIKPVYEKIDGISAPIVNITNGVIAGYKYLQFGEKAPKEMHLLVGSKVKGQVKVCIDGLFGEEIGAGEITDENEVIICLKREITGKHPVYITFNTDDEGATIDSFTSFWFE